MRIARQFRTVNCLSAHWLIRWLERLWCVLTFLGWSSVAEEGTRDWKVAHTGRLESLPYGSGKHSKGHSYFAFGTVFPGAPHRGPLPFRRGEGDM